VRPPTVTDRILAAIESAIIVETANGEYAAYFTRWLMRVLADEPEEEGR